MFVFLQKALEKLIDKNMMEKDLEDLAIISNYTLGILLANRMSTLIL